MHAELRELFDVQLEQVIAELPTQVQELIDKVPMVVEDYPSPAVMERMGIRHRTMLMGLYTGIPLTKRSVDQSGVPSDVIHIYREGIFHQSRSRDGQVKEAVLRKQIRKTILHEYGHHHGLSERDLRELGYG